MQNIIRITLNRINLKVLTLVTSLLIVTNQFTLAQNNAAIDITKTGIQIGQKVPDVLLSNLSNYQDTTGKEKETAKLSDFKGKLVILDFWATWCSPCVGMIPRMDSLQRQFKDKVKFISVTYQTEKEVLPFLARLEKHKGQKFDLTNLVRSKELNQLFPHIYLPHYVWIDGEGIVKAITGYQEITVSKIELALGKEYNFAQKKDLKLELDDNKPFLIDGNGGKGENLIYHSILTGYTEGIAGGALMKRPDSLQSGKLLMKNLSITKLLRYAFGEGKEWFNQNRIQFLVKDTSNLIFDGKQSYHDWIRKNGFCYELTVPPNLVEKRYKIMQQDLIRLFPNYAFTVENQIRKCLVLIRTSSEDKIASAGGDYRYASNRFGLKMQNHSLSRFIADLEVLYMQTSPYPIVNGTGYKNWVDIEINAPMGNIIEMNKALVKYDLAFELQDREIGIIVVRDPI